VYIYYGFARSAALGAPLSWFPGNGYSSGATALVYPLLFPSYLANSLHPVPLFIQAADVGGPILVSLVIVSVNVALFELLAAARARRRPAAMPLAVGGFALAGALIYGAVRLPQVQSAAAREPRMTVGLVQANMGIYQKHDDPAEGLRRHREMSLELERQGVDLLVWPESATVYPMPRTIRNVRDEVFGPVRTRISWPSASTCRSARRFPSCTSGARTPATSRVAADSIPCASAPTA
jgi:apolipoprotein N-acyltransferase